MTIDIKLVGWSAKGFRCPDHEVSLLDDKESPYPVSLIQMPNGTGKTTTLNLLRLTLSGAATTKSPSEIKQYSKRVDGVDKGIMEVKLTVNDSLITFILVMDYSNGKAIYKTTKGSGQVNGFSPPVEIGKFLNPHFIDYFILDGELANRLLKHQSAAQEAIDALFQVDTLKKISQLVHDHWSIETAGQATTEAGHTLRRNIVLELSSKIKFYSDERSKLQSEIEEILTKIEDKKSAFDDAIKNNESQKTALFQLKDRLSAAEKLQSNLTAQVFEASTSPQNLSPIFGHACINLKAGLDRVKLPEAAAKEFFEEICDELECICGEAMTPEKALAIKKKASQYLGSNDVTLLNAIKTSIGERVGSDPERNCNEFHDLLKKLRDAVRDVSTLTIEYSELTNRAGNEDPAIRQAQESIVNLTGEYALKLSHIERFDENDDSEDTHCISILKARLQLAEDRLAEITNTRALKNKTDKLQNILGLAYDKASKKITHEILQETNANILKWLPDNDIQVDKIDGHLWLKNATEGSVGENLSVAYAFLSTLFNRSTHSLPFIVDSPAGALGNSVRRQIGQTIPLLTKQFVTFVISSERQDFINGGIETVVDNIQYISIFRKKVAAYLSEAMKVPNKVITDDGAIVYDKNFFYKFEMDEEATL